MSLWGRECKPGWGYNDSLDLLVPVEGEPSNVTAKDWNEWIYGAQSLSTNNIYYSVSFLTIY